MMAPFIAIAPIPMPLGPRIYFTTSTCKRCVSFWFLRFDYRDQHNTNTNPISF